MYTDGDGHAVTSQVSLAGEHSEESAPELQFSLLRQAYVLHGVKGVASIIDRALDAGVWPADPDALYPSSPGPKCSK